ncbi:MAG TPA: hypothetical protein VNI77_03785 [Nitrososphaera sp.]|nr:hypothetical protein [Nitrososphaera sp.]
MVRKGLLILIIGAVAAGAAYSAYYVLATIPEPVPENIPENPIRIMKDDLSTKGIRGDLELALTVPKNSYIVGEKVPVKISLSNVGKEDVTIRSGQTLLEAFLTTTEENPVTVSSKADVGDGCPPPGENEQSRSTVLAPGEEYEFTFEFEAPKVVDSQSDFYVYGYSLGVVDPWDSSKYGHVSSAHCPLLLKTDTLSIEVRPA